MYKKDKSEVFFSEAAAGRDANANARWFAVNTQNRREALAKEHLERQGYNVFVPWTRKTVRHAGKFSTVRVAFFPGYIFVNMDINFQRWRPIDSTIGVLRLVKLGASPLPAPSGLVERLIAAVDADGLINFASQLNKGDRVRIVSGCFIDRLAVIQTKPSADRVCLLFEMLKQVITVEIDARDVKASYGPG